jgi:hypothetical protein
MSNVSIRRKIFVLIILVALATTPWASARGPQPGKPRAAQAVEDVPLLGNFWSFLRSFWEKEGCHIDPWGVCMDEPAPEIGCNIDPNGHCINEPTPKIGCHIDPWGNCIP